ncbi:unnamed protein product [Durusdinium trenchii]|uniref:Selenoprotein O n=1 Tax=Durusdinium trenchii TaxID=1381693 RepID=A0ABP0QDT9_9DINO
MSGRSFMRSIHENHIPTAGHLPWFSVTSRPLGNTTRPHKFSAFELVQKSVLGLKTLFFTFADPSCTARHGDSHEIATTSDLARFYGGACLLPQLLISAGLQPSKKGQPLRLFQHGSIPIPGLRSFRASSRGGLPATGGPTCVAHGPAKLRSACERARAASGTSEMVPAQWMCLLSTTRLRFAPDPSSFGHALLALPGLSDDGWYSADFAASSAASAAASLHRQCGRTLSKVYAAGVRCGELSLDFRGTKTSKANVWLSELVFWAASLATAETRLRLLPATEPLLEVVDESVGRPWHLGCERAAQPTEATADDPADDRTAVSASRACRFHPGDLVG